MTIGENLKALRREKNLSQKELSESTGISQGSIARWELNKTEPRASEIKKLCEFFSISSDEFLEIIL